jgi:hypothetical protein
MPDNAQVIQQLEAASAALDSQLLNTPGDDDLINTKLKIQAEIGAIETNALNNAAYIPQTDAFKKETQEGKAFLDLLEKIKTSFAALGTVLGAVEDVIKFLK